MQNISSQRQPLIVAVCGDSGSGKTTLTDGTVRVFGHTILDRLRGLTFPSRILILGDRDWAGWQF